MRRCALCLLTFAVLATGGASAQAQDAALACSGKQKLRQVAELLFGRDIGREIGISKGAFARFLSREITPRFPDGLTVSDASGQWRSRPGGPIVHEPTKRVEIVLPGASDDQAQLDAVVEAYKREFQQQSVAVIVRPACVSF
jgi:hypothetical protein